MSATEALKAARDAGLSLELDGNDIVLEAPKPPPAVVLDLLARNKASIVRLLKDDGFFPHSDTPFELCAGFIEYDPLGPRTWAESLTWLDPARPPGDVPPKRWVQFIDDCGNFVDNGWARRDAALGWTAFDLFGSDRSKPFARIGSCGLLWLLDGRQLRILTAETAIIENASGSSVTFYRRPHEPGQVLAWTLAP